VQNLNNNPGGGASATFDLPAHSTGEVMLYANPYQHGYGMIEWTQQSSNVVGLVAHMFSAEYYYSGIVYLSQYTIPINNGLPF